LRRWRCRGSLPTSPEARQCGILRPGHDLVASAALVEFRAWAVSAQEFSHHVVGLCPEVAPVSPSRLERLKLSRHF
jgi:hypothetical protein